MDKKMPCKLNEILGLGLLTLALLLFGALISFHPSDCTLFTASSEGNCSVSNWIGFVGANIAWCLFFSLGLGAYIFPGLAFWLSYRAFRDQRAMSSGTSQILGILLAIASFVALLTLIIPKVRYCGEVIPSGGFVGVLITRYLKDWFNLVGTFMLLAGSLLIGILLATPFSFRSSCVRLQQLYSLVALKIAKAIGSRSQVVSPKPPKLSDDRIKATKPRGVKNSVSSPKRVKKPFNSSSTYELPPIELLDNPGDEEVAPDPQNLEKNARLLEEKLADFGVLGKVVGIQPGPVITLYEYVPAPGIKISRIVSLTNDLAMALRAESLRVVAPIPGKAAIGIELPNFHRAIVSIRSVLESREFQASKDPLMVALGKDITGRPVVTNLARMPHLLIAGATGTGKSVCINVILTSLLYRNTPEELRLLLIDPKHIELISYEGIPHLLHPVVTDVKMATKALQWAVKEMELRYRLMAEKNVRNIASYNRLVGQSSEEDGKKGETDLAHHYMPLVVIVIDELADLMMVASREVENYIMRLAQMARAAGIHLILATQRPSVDVLTGVIKANIPTRLSFQVSSRVDSRTILDTVGAETLLGAGDMLFLPPGTAKLQRIHGAFISEKEVERVTRFWISQKLSVDPLADRVVLSEKPEGSDIPGDEIDEKYEEAVELVLKTRQASISMLQRRLRVGYNRAARMIEIMEQQGIVGPSDGVKPREVLLPPRE